MEKKYTPKNIIDKESRKNLLLEIRIRKEVFEFKTEIGV